MAVNGICVVSSEKVLSEMVRKIVHVARDPSKQTGVQPWRRSAGKSPTRCDSHHQQYTSQQTSQMPVVHRFVAIN